MTFARGLNRVRSVVDNAGEDPAVECAVSDPIGKEGVVAFPLSCGAGGGLESLPPYGRFRRFE